jgi:hypothetical protein
MAHYVTCGKRRDAFHAAVFQAPNAEHSDETLWTPILAESPGGLDNQLPSIKLIRTIRISLSTVRRHGRYPLDGIRLS